MIDVRHTVVRPIPQQEGGREPSRRRGCLDAETALPRTPEEAGPGRVETVNGNAVRREASEARPAPLDRFYGPVDHMFESVDCRRNIDFLGRGIARVGLDFVMRT